MHGADRDVSLYVEPEVRAREKPLVSATELKPKWRKTFVVSDISPLMISELEKRIKQGATPTVAAKALGIPRGTFVRWMRTGQEQVEKAYETGEAHFAIEREAYLWLGVTEASGTLAVELAKTIKAGHEASKQRQWLLERLERDDFGQTETIDVQVGGSGVPVAVEGRAVVSLGDVIRLVEATGQPHLLGGLVRPDVGPAGARLELPAAPDVLSDPAASVEPAGDVPADGE